MTWAFLAQEERLREKSLVRSNRDFAGIETIDQSSSSEFFGNCVPGGSPYRAKDKKIPCSVSSKAEQPACAAERRTPTLHCDFRFWICSSRSCFSGTSLGASIIRSKPRLFFGNAITSLMFEVPVINITKRSTPRAIPPCGGAP